MTTLINCLCCGVAAGQPHINECDIEHCSICGERRATCGCEGHNPMDSVWTGEWPTSYEKWLVAYYYGESHVPLHYLGTPERPEIFSEQEALEKAMDLNVEIINMAQEEAFDGELQIWRYAAVPFLGPDCPSSHASKTEAEVPVSETSHPHESLTAKDVYWDYAERHGIDVAQHAVIAYFDPETVVDLLLDHIDVDSLDEFLNDNLTEEPELPPAEHPAEQQVPDFLVELAEFHPEAQQHSGDRVNWQQDGF